MTELISSLCLTNQSKAFIPLGLVIVSGALSIVGIEASVPLLTIVFKPLTTLLLLVVVGWPSSHYARFVVAGILLSVVGDVALLGDSALAFEVGLGAFLLAHIAYIVGAVRVGVRSARLVVVAILAVGATGLLLSMLWEGAAGMRIPLVIYGAALTTMVISSWSTLGSRLRAAPFAAAGSLLFYISDASLSLNRFYQLIPHVSFLSLGVYWLGQMGISLAARGGIENAAGTSSRLRRQSSFLQASG